MADLNKLQDLLSYFDPIGGEPLVAPAITEGQLQKYGAIKRLIDANGPMSFALAEKVMKNEHDARAERLGDVVGKMNDKIEELINELHAEVIKGERPVIAD